MIDLTLLSEINQEQRGNLITAKEAAKHLLNLINDILDLSKIESGKFELEKSNFDLHSFMKSTMRTFSGQAEAKGIVLETDISPDVPHYLWGDPIRLRQILFNLLGNAFKFTDSGRISVAVESASTDEQAAGSPPEKDGRVGAGVSRCGTRASGFPRNSRM